MTRKVSTPPAPAGDSTELQEWLGSAPGTPAPASVIAGTSQDPMSKRLSDLASETNWDLPVKRGQALTGRELQQWLLDREERALKGRVERGVGYTVLKSELGHGAFIAWLREHGLSEREVQRDIKTAKVLMTLSSGNAKRASVLPQRKLEVLASLPAPVLDDLFDEGALDNANEMSREELTEIVKLRKDYADLKTKNATLAMQLEKARDDAGRKPNEWPLPVRRAREESVIHGAHAVAIADEMSKELALLREGLETGAVDQVGEQAAVTAIYFAALQAAQRFSAVAISISEVYGNLTEESIQPLTANELKRVDTAVDFLVEALRGAGAGRENNRLNTQPGRRGRKRAA